MRAWGSDARHFQIAALSTLLGINFCWIDFGAKPLHSAIAIASALGTQALFSHLFRLPQIDLRSALITGLSLSLLLQANQPWLPAIAGVIAIASKFFLRIDGKHIWNPAGFAIVVLLTTCGDVWISPGQWGTSVWLGTLVSFLAILVLHSSQRWDIALFFLGSHTALLLARASWLGDPLAVPMHQLQSGSLLIFAFFMISDPRTTPNSRIGRLIFALAVALLAHYLAFFMQMRPALYVALFALSPVTLLIDRFIPAIRFEWISNHSGSFSMTRSFPWARLKKQYRSCGHLRPTSCMCRTGERVLRLLRRQGRFENVQQIVEGRAGARRPADRHHHGQRLRRRAEGIRVGRSGADLHREESDQRRRAGHGRSSRRLFRAAAGRVLRPGPVRITPSRRSDPFPLDNCGKAATMPCVRSQYRGVKVEAQYDVAEYDVIILSAEESDGLINWLNDNDYKIPTGAEPVIASYIKQNMHFFVAKVNVKRMQELGRAYLRPLQVHYETSKYMLPLRLGTVNANGPQDLIVYALSRTGAIEATNYRTVKVPSDFDVPLYREG